MSRALDKTTAAALTRGDPDAAYRAIARVLVDDLPAADAVGGTAGAAARLEIEFLGSEHPALSENSYVLRDGNAVAVPKLALVQAFIVARKILRTHWSVPASFPVPENGDDAPDRVRHLLRATAVILLMDPEHLTAANTRKRLLEDQLLMMSTNASAAATVLGRERQLVDSLLTSHLHRHTKSPTLWNHRRWLVSVGARLADGRAASGLAIDSVRDITEVVMVAGIRHPRNYYAWDHARWLIHHQQGAAAPELVTAVRDWCYHHHTDTSGWSFLAFLLVATPSASPVYAETVGQVLEMAVSLRWTGEAVWVFLKTLVAYDTLHRSGHEGSDMYSRFMAATASLQNPTNQAAPENAILQRSRDWCARTVSSDH